MEKYGITVEKDALKEYGDQLIGRIEELEQNIYEKAGKTFNINSPKQLGVILFEDLKAFCEKDKNGLFNKCRYFRKACTGLSNRIRDFRVSSAYKVKVNVCRRTGCIYSG